MPPASVNGRFSFYMPKILISAGHSLSDPGAKSADGKYVEADLAILLRNAVLDELRANGVDAIGDGEVLENLPLKQSIALARTAKIAVEIHFNASSNPLVRGVEVLALPKHKLLAQSLAKAIAGITNSKLRGEGGYKPQEQSQHQRLGFVQAGGLIIEVEFISNPEAMARYMANQGKVAWAIADVLQRKLGKTISEPKPERQVEP